DEREPIADQPPLARGARSPLLAARPRPDGQRRGGDGGNGGRGAGRHGCGPDAGHHAGPGRRHRHLAGRRTGDARVLERLQHRRPPRPPQHQRGAAQPRSGHQRARRRACHCLGVAGRADDPVHPAAGRGFPRRRPPHRRGRRIRCQLHVVAGERLRHRPVHGIPDHRHRRRRPDPRRPDRGARPDSAGDPLFRAAAECPPDPGAPGVAAGRADRHRPLPLCRVGEGRADPSHGLPGVVGHGFAGGRPRRRRHPGRRVRLAAGIHRPGRPGLHRRGPDRPLPGARGLCHDTGLQGGAQRRDRAPAARHRPPDAGRHPGPPGDRPRHRQGAGGRLALRQRRRRDAVGRAVGGRLQRRVGGDALRPGAGAGFGRGGAGGRHPGRPADHGSGPSGLLPAVGRARPVRGRRPDRDRPQCLGRADRARRLPGAVRAPLRRDPAGARLDRHPLPWQRADGRRVDGRLLVPLRRRCRQLLRPRARRADRRRQPADRRRAGGRLRRGDGGVPGWLLGHPDRPPGVPLRDRRRSAVGAAARRVHARQGDVVRRL
ncbi:MAG: Dipeptide-binding ABC transporter, periplasmic substrate-binding component, partial [uncultured Thermomicrobiales bacterium]